MKLIVAFLRLIRWPNLFFIALTQSLFQFCIYYPLYKEDIPANDLRHFVFITIASLFIAAAGYIINDYFDIDIDRVNKPGKIVVSELISRRWAIAWHMILSVTGLLFTILAFPHLRKWYLIAANLLAILLLWLYSTSFKKKLLIGNIVISLLTAWTILIIFFSKFSLKDAFGHTGEADHKFFRLAFLYAGFAFILSLIREVIKDMEDLEGDLKYGCRTMPIVWGINASKVFAAVWLIVLIIILVIAQIYILQFGWWWQDIYIAFAILVPLGYLFAGLYKANTAGQFHSISSLSKWIMLSGILSMIFFWFYL
ncbi:MAG: geranylgeranylglycerol-phosphate geranylgeranyltransferase [Bacteroidetes bacterium]|nr:geranylgeranylglycerol-phosphate geranylgeranyltransferase [Bacteroidota bacterium]